MAKSSGGGAQKSVPSHSTSKGHGFPYKTASGAASKFPSSVSKKPTNVVATVGGAKNAKGGK